MRIFLLAGMLLVAQTSYAIADLQLGFRWSSYEGISDMKDFTSIDMVVGAHLAPLPLMPVSLGLLVGLGGYGHDETKDKHHGSMDVGVMVRGWLPMIPIVTPYAWFRHTLWGHWEYGSDKDRLQGDLSGYFLGIGAKYDFFPLLHAFLELGYGDSTFGQDTKKKKFEEFFGKGSSKDDVVDLSTISIAFGVGVGL